MSLSFLDPPRVRHLGEFASLKKAILSHFDGDSGLRFHSDEERWRSIASHYTSAERNLIAIQIGELLSRDDAFIVQFWDKHSDYYAFQTAEEVRGYLEGKVALLD